MNTVEKGLFISVEYKGTLKDGEVFDTSEGRSPLEVEMGGGQLIKGFEDALMGMSLNEKKVFTLKPEQAYGMRDENLTRSFNRSDIPPEMDPKVGLMVAVSTEESQQVPAQIIKLDDKTITVDLNHPLAGQSLTFDIEVVGINDKPTQQQPGCGCGCDCSSDNCA